MCVKERMKQRDKEEKARLMAVKGVLDLTVFKEKIKPEKTKVNKPMSEERKKKVSAYQKQYRERTKEDCKEYQKAWYIKNKEAILSKQRKYRENKNGTI